MRLHRFRSAHTIHLVILTLYSLKVCMHWAAPHWLHKWRLWGQDWLCSRLKFLICNESPVPTQSKRISLSFHSHVCKHCATQTYKRGMKKSEQVQCRLKLILVFFLHLHDSTFMFDNWTFNTLIWLLILQSNIHV